MNEKNNKGSLAAAFTIGTTAFAAHAGGGFATGNQANTYFVGLGWVSILSAVLAMVILALSVREAQIMWNTRNLKSYKELFSTLFHPFDRVAYVFDVFYYIMILMVVASCIAGAASALKQYLGMPYQLAAVGIGLLILVLSIFGAGLIRKASTYMGIVILVLSITIYAVGLLKGHNLFAAMGSSFQSQGLSMLPKAVFNAFTYAGAQWVTIPGVLACGTILKTKKDCTKGMFFMLLFNCIGLGLSVLMLLSWHDYFMAVEGGSTLPTLTVLMNMDMGVLVIAYCVVLLLCMVSSGVVVVFGFVNRVENAKCLSFVKGKHVRRALIAVFIMLLSMSISFIGLTNIVKFGYGYCGYIAICVAILPLLTIGYFKNRKFIKAHPVELQAYDDEEAEKELSLKLSEE